MIKDASCITIVISSIIIIIIITITHHASYTTSCTPPLPASQPQNGALAEGHEVNRAASEPAMSPQQQQQQQQQHQLFWAEVLKEQQKTRQCRHTAGYRSLTATESTSGRANDDVVVVVVVVVVMMMIVFAQS